jgi:hypothetical protein
MSSTELKAERSLKKRNIWKYVSIALLIACMTIGALLVRNRIQFTRTTYEKRYTKLKPHFIDLAHFQKNLLEVLMIRERDNPKQFFSEYCALSTEDFESRLRQEIVSLTLRVENLGQDQEKSPAEKYSLLRQAYIDIARAQSKLLAPLVKNKFDLTPHFDNW